jgi:hypothetical protein
LSYVTSTGPAHGALLRRDVAGTIEVLEALGEATPVGTGFCIGANPAGVALWRLSIRGVTRPEPVWFCIAPSGRHDRSDARCPPSGTSAS